MNLNWAKTPTIPAPYTAYHQVWTTELDDSGNPVKDNHGNNVAYLAPPVPRPVQSINLLGNAEFRTDAREVVSSEFTNRSDVLVEVGVPDVSLYKERDVVILNASGADENGNPIGGTAYHVDGPPADNQQSPFPLLSKLVGGGIVVRRVT